MIDQPHQHPAYNDALERARARAKREPGERFVVYWDGNVVYMRIGSSAPPPGAYSVYAVTYSNGTYHGHYFPTRGLSRASVTLAIDPQSSVLSRGGRALVRAAEAILDEHEIFETAAAARAAGPDGDY